MSSPSWRLRGTRRRLAVASTRSKQWHARRRDGPAQEHGHGQAEGGAVAKRRSATDGRTGPTPSGALC
eukprot:15318746-Alexandrium_andersonii.AAC.1